MTISELKTITSHDQALADALETLDYVNFQIAELKTIKEELEAKIIERFGHNKEGRQTYQYDKYKVAITTNIIASLDKDEYQVYKNHIPEQFNPVRESVKYDVDKRKLREVEQYASDYELGILSKFITKKPGKPSVKLEANT